MSDLETTAREIAAWVRAEAENKDYAAACEWRNVADAIEREAEDKLWLCGDCNGLNGMHEAFCWRCGAGPPEAGTDKPLQSDELSVGDQWERVTVRDLKPGDEVQASVIASNEGWDWISATVLSAKPLRLRWWDNGAEREFRRQPLLRRQKASVAALNQTRNRGIDARSE